MALVIWHAIVHFLGVDYGVAYGHWIWYNMWSGVGGSFLVGALVFFATWYANHTCHDSRWCVRYGRYPAAGGVFRVCHHHHPDMAGQRPHREMIARLHEEWKRGPRGAAG